MARGIHLKQLRSADLQAIGVSDTGLLGTAGDQSGRPRGLLAEADPVLSQTLREMRRSLEATLEILEQALAATTPGQGAAAPPRDD
jgi:hypothetical protein